MELTSDPDVPGWLRLGVPLIAYPLLLVSIAYRPLYALLIRKEGLVEYAAVVVLLVGVGYGVAMLWRYRQALPHRGLAGWFALAVAAMFLFAGEEISWGQHLGLWDSEDVPEAIKQINDQNETNFHNITNALDQGPTNLIVVLTLVGFVLNPLYLRWRGETMAPDNPGYWFWPTRAGLPTAIGVLIIPFPKRLYEWTTDAEGPVTLRHSEMHEFYIAVLMTIYVVSAHHRLRAAAAGTSAARASQADGSRMPSAAPDPGQRALAGSRSSA